MVEEGDGKIKDTILSEEVASGKLSAIEIVSLYLSYFPGFLYADFLASKKRLIEVLMGKMAKEQNTLSCPVLLCRNSYKTFQGENAEGLQMNARRMLAILSGQIEGDIFTRFLALTDT